MRRVAALLATALLAAGCAAGEDGARATELLAEAQAADARLLSATYDLEISFSKDGQTFRAVAEGGDVRKGKRAGEQFLRLRLEGVPGFPASDMLMVVQGGSMRLTMNGVSQTMPFPEQTAGPQAQALGAGFVHRLGRAVESVTVDEGALVAGQPVTTIRGVVDTKALFAAFAELAGLADLAKQSFDAGEVADRIGDIDVTLVLSEPDHLLRAAFVDLEIDGAELGVVYRLTGVDVPVTLPRA